MTKRNGKVKTVPRMSFVFGSKTSEEATALERLRYILDKVVWCLKARKHNPMGALIWKYLINVYFFTGQKGQMIYLNTITASYCSLTQ
jgi:hypothetical protein